MPQGTGIGPLSFVVYIKGMPHAKDILSIKYVDDTTLSEFLKSLKSSKMQESVDSILTWSTGNKMLLNEKKTKELIITFKKSPVLPDPLVMNGVEVERISGTKLLGVNVSDDLTWNDHVSYMLSRVTPRLYYLKQLKRAGLGISDLLEYYKAVVRSVVEYASPVWNSGLTQEQSEDLERVQERALKIIFPGASYNLACQLGSVQTLQDR